MDDKIKAKFADGFRRIRENEELLRALLEIGDARSPSLNIKYKNPSSKEEILYSSIPIIISPFLKPWS